MESVTYNCYTAADLEAQAETIVTALQNVQAALLKVAENDVDAGVLEEIKALLGMSGESTTATPEPSASEPSTVTPSDAKEPATKGADTETTSTDTKDASQAVSEPSKTSEPHTVIVQPGDTLQTLAEKTGATPRHLIEANMLMEPVVLRPGQTLKY